MPQTRLPFHYAEESKPTGVTSVSGLAMYLEVAHAAGLSESASRHVKVREGAQGWTDAQMDTSLILLNTAGGESVDDLRILESDDGLGRVIQSAETGQQYAEVCYVPNWIGHSKNSPDYRFIAIREPLRNPSLPGMESQLELSVPTMQMGDGGWYKVTGVVTNRGLRGDELVWWYRQRCGKGEEVHAVLKEDLAGGRLPSGLFGANAAWWAITVLAFNLNSAVKRLVLGREWVSKRLKAVRFGVINLAGRVVRHARGLTIRLGRGHPSYELLVSARRRILALANTPPGA